MARLDKVLLVAAMGFAAATGIGAALGIAAAAIVSDKAGHADDARGRPVKIAHPGSLAANAANHGSGRIGQPTDRIAAGAAE